MTTQAVEILEVVVVEPDRSLRLPSKAQWKQVLTEPGEYAVVRLAEVRDRKAVEPAKRLFHLGDLRWTDDEVEALQRAGLALSTQVRAAGVPVLRRMIGDELTQKLVQAFERLGMSIPDREGEPPRLLPDALDVRGELRRGYEAHAEVWRIREGLAALSREEGQSSFVQHSAGFDVVCGICGAQHLAVKETEATTLVCSRCGNDIGVDFRVERERLQPVVRPKR